MKIGDNVRICAVYGWGNNKYVKCADEGIVYALNEKTKEFRYKTETNVYRSDMIGFVFVPSKFFGLSGNYWTNDTYMKENLSIEDMKFELNHRQKDIKAGWKF